MTKTQRGDRFSRNMPFSAQGFTLEADRSETPAPVGMELDWF